MIYQILKNFQKNNLFHPEMILRHLFALKIPKNPGLLLFISLKQKKLIFNFLLTITEKN